MLHSVDFECSVYIRILFETGYGVKSPIKLAGFFVSFKNAHYEGVFVVYSWSNLLSIRLFGSLANINKKADTSITFQH